MVFHPVQLIIEIIVVLFYILGLVFFLDVLFFWGMYIGIWIAAHLFLRHLVLSTSTKGTRPRRDIIGYAIMFGAPFVGLLNFYVEVIIVYIGASFFLSRAFHELRLWIKLIRLGEDYDQELSDLSTGWENELMGEDTEDAYNPEKMEELRERKEEEEDREERHEERILEITSVLQSEEKVEWASKGRSKDRYLCLGVSIAFILPLTIAYSV